MGVYRMIKKLAKFYNANVKKQEKWANNTVLVPVSNPGVNYSNGILMTDIIKQNKERDMAFLFNKLNTIREISEERFSEAVFITLTADSDFVNLAKEDFYFNKDINNNFNNLFRAFFKNRLFRKELPANKRLYINVNEFTKNLVLHKHFLQYLDSEEQALKYVDSFSSTYLRLKKDLNLGRCEVVVSSKVFEYLKKSDLLHFVKLGKEKVLKFKKESKSSGNFIYFKTLKENGNNKGLTSYIMKYVMKNIKSDDMTDFQKACSYLHSTLNIRRYNFSRYVFPKSLYYNLVDSRNIPIYKLYSLKRLTELRNDNKMIIEYNNIEKQKKEKTNYEEYLFNKVFDKFIKQSYAVELEIIKLYGGDIEEFSVYKEQNRRKICYNNIVELEYSEDLSVFEQNFLEYYYNNFEEFENFEFSEVVSVEIGSERFVPVKKQSYIIMRG